MDNLTLIPENSIPANLNKATKETFRLLTLLSKNAEFLDKMAKTYGNEFDLEQLNVLCQQWRSGDFSNLPQIKILSTTELNGVRGAFSAETNTIYLSREFITQKPKEITRVLLQEIGHWVDTKINKIDAVGDEGAIFSALATGHNLSNTQLAQLKAINDFDTIVVDGKTISIEKASFEGTNLSDLQSGLVNVIDTLNTSLKTVAFANSLPLVGDALKDSSDSAVNFLTELKNTINSLNTNSAEQVRQDLFTALKGLGWLLDRNGNGDVDDLDIELTESDTQVLFNFSLGQTPVSLQTGIGFDIGLLGLGLTVNDDSKVKTDISFSFDLKFGVDKNTGFFFDTAGEDELKVNLETTLPNFNAIGELGFLQVEITDNTTQPTMFAGTFGLDIQSGLNVTPTLTGQADINLHLQGKIPTTSDTDIPLLPSLGTDLSLSWGFNDTDASNPLNPSFGDPPQLAFKNVSLNLGSFFSEFVNPILGPVQDALSPIEPIIDFLTDDLPLVGFSLIDLIELLSKFQSTIPQGLPGGGQQQITTGIKVIDFLDTILSIPTDSANTPIALGDFNLLGGNDLRTSLLSNFTVDNFNSILNDVEQALRDIGADDAVDYLNNTKGGLTNNGPTFPLVEDPKQAFGLLLGKDPDLFRWNLSDTLRVADKDSKFFGKIIGVNLSYEYSAGLNLVLGFDTNG